MIQYVARKDDCDWFTAFVDETAVIPSEVHLIHTAKGFSEKYFGIHPEAGECVNINSYATTDGTDLLLNCLITIKRVKKEFAQTSFYYQYEHTVKRL